MKMVCTGCYRSSYLGLLPILVRWESVLWQHKRGKNSVLGGEKFLGSDSWRGKAGADELGEWRKLGQPTDKKLDKAARAKVHGSCGSRLGTYCLSHGAMFKSFKQEIMQWPLGFRKVSQAAELKDRSKKSWVWEKSEENEPLSRCTMVAAVVAAGVDGAVDT